MLEINNSVALNSDNVNDLDDTIAVYNLINQDLEYYSLRLKTPSEILKPSLTFQEFEILRYFHLRYIRESCTLLKLPYLCNLTASNLFNRFYYKHSFQKYDGILIAIASIFLSTKIQECNRKLKDLLAICYHTKTKLKEGLNSKSNIHILEVQSDLYEDIRKKIIIAEKYLLSEVGFNVYQFCNHPHKYLLHASKILGGNKLLLQRAWNFLNDSYMTSVNICFPPQSICCAAILYGSRLIDFTLPYLDWWEIFSSNIRDIQDICSEVLNLNYLNYIKYIEVEKIYRKHNLIRDTVAIPSKINHNFSDSKEEKYKNKYQKERRYSRHSCRGHEDYNKYYKKRERSRSN